MRYDKLLLRGGYKIGVWGAGYIGFSTMVFFAKNGVKTIGCDISKERINVINSGKYIMPDLEKWLNFSIKSLVRNGFIKATLNHEDFISEKVIVHFIAIPTERSGRPYFAILEDTIKRISSLFKAQKDNPKPLIIIESTLSPRTSDTIIIPLFSKYGIKVGVDILYGVAPRRDWFVDGGKNLIKLDRVFGGYDNESSDALGRVLGIVCKRLHRASNCYVAEMVKSFENAYRHVEITLANQISLAYPRQNIREALELAGTKWNIGTFRPGFGTGGYCIPVASKYVLDGAEKNKELGILNETIKTDRKINILIARSVIKRKLRKVAVLGLSYKGNLKVSVLSPTIPFIETLVKAGVDVRIFDPYFSKEEIGGILGIPMFSFPGDLDKFEAIVLIVDHKKYLLSRKKMIESLHNCKFILDNTGLWSKYRDIFTNKGINYHLAGDAGWI